MENKPSFITKRAIIGVYIFLLILMAAGSFCDYQISLALYDETNIIANLFAAYGEFPTYLGLVMAGVMSLAYHDQQKLGFGIIQCIVGIISLAYGVYRVFYTPSKYLDCSLVVIVIVGIAILVLIIGLTLKLCEGADPEMIRKISLIILLTIIAEVAVVNIIKNLWGRPRMRLVANDSRACFMPWYSPDGSLKEALVAAGVEAGEFKSFPSGHTANAATILLLTLLPYIKPELEQHRNKLFWIGFVFACIVGFTRIIMGAHYLTDVTMGFAISFGIMLLVSRLILGRKPKKE